MAGLSLSMLNIRVTVIRRLNIAVCLTHLYPVAHKKAFANSAHTHTHTQDEKINENHNNNKYYLY